MKNAYQLVVIFAAATTWLAHVGSTAATADDANDLALTKALRRPIALQFTADERFVITANRRSGTLSLVDLEAKRVVREVAVGKQLSSLVSLPTAGDFLVTDEQAHELILIRVAGIGSPSVQIEVRQRLPVSPYPVSVSVTRDGRRAFVASLWSRRLSVVQLATHDAAAAVAKTIDLEIAPRSQLLVENDRRLIVADSFAAKLEIIDTDQGKRLGIREFPGHNVRGLGISQNGKMLVVAHQMLNDYAHTTRNDVHWGLLMSNDLRWLRLDSVLEGAKDLYVGGHMHPLGHAGNAMGDPTALALAADGTVVVSVGGTAEVSFGKEGDFSLQRLDTGRRPNAVVVTRDSRRAVTANSFGDSISVVDLAERETLREISLGPTGELSVVDRGELLFYDAKMSHDGWMSCHSCHTDGHSNAQMNDNFSDASFGAPKRVLTLLGRADTAPFAWNASSKTLSEQIGKSIANTMQGDRTPTTQEIRELTAYVESLTSPPSIDVLRGTANAAQIGRGKELFQEQKCVDCHAPPTYTTPKTYNVGLKDKQGNDHFNPPSLRGVAQRAPYFHDNRAATLPDLFREHGHQLQRAVSDEELDDLVAFLRSL